MGAGIAAVASEAGYDVILVEPDAAARERAAARAPKATLRAQARSDERVVLAIEAVPERLALKRFVFATLARELPNATLATNTSSLSVAEIAGAAPERAVGMHFFNPPEKMRLVEIVRTATSAQSAVDAALEFVTRIGRTAILTADTPGFVVNRVARPYYLQALRALELGVASTEEMDALARGIGFRMGPFELMDFIGLDVNLATSESMYQRTKAARFEPRSLQRELVARGRLGRKTGSGFYDYDVPLQRIDLREATQERRSQRSRTLVLGTRELAGEIAFALETHYGDVARVERDDDGTIDASAPLLFDTGDGVGDRAQALARIESRLSPECVIFVDAYATDVTRAATLLARPERLIGYGIIGALDDQAGVEIVASKAVAPRSFALATEMFAAIGRGVVRVADVPGLYVGRTITAIVEEARLAVGEGVASEEDVDEAMRLGTNYPRGPIAWGRAIGEARVERVLRRINDASRT